MAGVSTIYPEDDNGVKEVHKSPKCEMVKTPYNLRGRRVFIFVRKCVCKEYENTYRHGIDFQRDDLLDVDGVFIHHYEDCFLQRQEIRGKRRMYIFETDCDCVKESENKSYLR